jgi:hypothetical protein
MAASIREGAFPMRLPFVLAHGALGNWDEIIFLGIAVIFLAMMGISWLRSRFQTLEDPPATPDTASEPESVDRFPLN